MNIFTGQQNESRSKNCKIHLYNSVESKKIVYHLNRIPSSKHEIRIPHFPTTYLPGTNLPPNTHSVTTITMRCNTLCPLITSQGCMKRLKRSHAYVHAQQPCPSQDPCFSTFS